MKSLFLAFLLTFSFLSFSQKASNVRVDGILYVPKTTTQRLGITNLQQGMTCYQSDGLKGLYVYNGTNWNFTGKSDTLNITVLANGNVGINKTNPDVSLFVVSSQPTTPTVKISSGNGVANTGASIFFNAYTPMPNWETAKISGTFGGGGMVGNLNFRVSDQSGNPNEVMRISGQAGGQVRIGDQNQTTGVNVILAVSGNGGFLIPRMTQSQRISLGNSNAVGLQVYQTDNQEGVWINKSTGWVFGY